MVRRAYFLSLAIGLVLSVGCAHTRESGTARETKHPTALDSYVAKEDPTYSWEVVNTLEADGVTTFVVDMKSQTWRAPEEVDRTVWQHWLIVAKPHEVKSDTALMFIGGGRNGKAAPDSPEGFLGAIAKTSSAVVAQLGMVPNQPLTFSDDGVERSEDSYIAYTWDKYLRTGDDQWPARLPMTKSAVRAMDTITALLASPEGGGATVDKFVVAGGSKRGWTTWTTAAVDTRVVAICPIVIDMLNVVPSFKHHWAAYGFWAPAVGDYDRMGLMDWTDTPEYAALLDIVEPYSYRERLTMPKLMMNSTGDQFFLPDSSQFYFDDLKGVKGLRYVPNTDHGLGGSDAQATLLAFFLSIINGVPMPEFSWTFPDAELTRVECAVAPVEVKLWQANNPEARDFRKESIGEAWTSTDLSDAGGKVFTGHVATPEKGWTAFMIELTFAGPGGAPFKMTTPVRVVPDTLPFDPPVPAVTPKGFITGKK